jgi:hypothetical protein
MRKPLHLHDRVGLAFAISLILASGLSPHRARAADDSPALGPHPSGGAIDAPEVHGSSVTTSSAQGQRLLFLGWDKELTGTSPVGFSKLHEFLTTAGHVVEEDRVPSRPITLARLQQFDVVAFGGLPTSQLSATELEAFREYVRDGGNLFLGGQWGDYNANWQNNNNGIGAYFGITFHQDLFCNPSHHLTYSGSCSTSPGDPDSGREYPLLDVLTPHPVAAGVTMLMLNWGQSLSGGVPVIFGSIESWSDLGATLEPQPADCLDPWFVNERDPEEPQGLLRGVVAEEYRAGKVVATGDVDFWWNWAFDLFSHRQILANILEWFAAPPVCEYTALTSGTPLDSESMDLVLCTFEPVEARWGAIGARSSSPWRVRVYAHGAADGVCVTDLLADSATSDPVDFVVGDFHGNDLRTYYAKVDNVDALTPVTTEWDGGTRTLEPSSGGSPGLRGAPAVRSGVQDWILDVYDVQLDADTDYGFNLESNGAVRMLLFQSAGETTWAGRQDAIWEAQGSRTYTAVAAGIYGLVLVNESPGPASYSVLVRKSTPLPVAVSFRTEIAGSTPKVLWELQGLRAETPVSLWRWRTTSTDRMSRLETNGVLLESSLGSAGEYVDHEAQPGATYTYALVGGSSSDAILAESSIAVTPGKSVALGPAVPNPFNPSTRVYYDVPGGSNVTVEIFDVLGRRIRVLLDASLSASRTEAAPASFVTWDGTDAATRPVATGVYFVRLRAVTPTGRVLTAGCRLALLR